MKLTDIQLRVMRDLDGAWSIREYSGAYGNSLRSLQRAGMVSVNRIVEFGKVVYLVDLTKKGADFIFNGGIDG